MFESTRKKKKDKKHLIGSAVVADHAAVEMTEKANVEYHKPKYSSQNRKKFYDNHSALNNAKDKAFKNGENAIDPYSGKNLVKTQKEAVANYGDDWQAHVAESDHIYPLNKGVKDFQDDAFLKTDDIKAIMNSEDNIQIISRKNNQTGGKGGKHNRTVLKGIVAVAKLKEYISRAEKMNNDFLLTKAEARVPDGLHYCRAMCAQITYNAVLQDMENDPAKRAEYIQKIKDEFKRCGRKLKENLDKPYRLRGYNREAALSIGKPVVYDRVAAMYVSLFILHHFRTDTTILHYLVK